MRITDLTLFESKATQITVFYGGRFQPMHRGHRDVYKHLVDKFGADNVFIATTFSKKAEAAHAAGNYSSDPFTFEEKKSIISKMFGIPSDKIVKVNPYSAKPSDIGRNDSTSACVLVYGEKDAGRLKMGGILSPLPDDMNNLQSHDSNRIYVYVAPLMQGGMSASDFRKVMADPNVDAKTKQQEFQKFFGKFDEQVFNFIEERLGG